MFIYNGRKRDSTDRCKQTAQQPPAYSRVPLPQKITSGGWLNYASLVSPNRAAYPSSVLSCTAITIIRIRRAKKSYLYFHYLLLPTSSPLSHVSSRAFLAHVTCSHSTHYNISVAL